jgi:hypothetical protein
MIYLLSIHCNCSLTVNTTVQMARERIELRSYTQARIRRDIPGLDSYHTIPHSLPESLRYRCWWGNQSILVAEVHLSQRFHLGLIRYLVAYRQDDEDGLRRLH